MLKAYDVGADSTVYVPAGKEIAILESGVVKRSKKSFSHKLITMPSETLRLYEPSTLFDTQALGNRRQRYPVTESTAYIHGISYEKQATGQIWQIWVVYDVARCNSRIMG